MTVLVDIFDTLDLNGVFYYRTDFSPPWSLKVPHFGQAARFHLVVQGSTYLTFESGKRVHLTVGDLVLIPAGRSHILSSNPVTDAPDLETVLESVGYDGKGVVVVGDGDSQASTQLICGHLDFRGEAGHPILSALPELIHVSASDRAKNIFLDDVLRLIVRSVMSNKFASSASIKLLSEIVFVEVICSGADSDTALGSVLEAFTDEQIGRALDALHKNISHPWTVGSLASEVGMSRSRFAEKFSDLMKMGPMAYLSEWRLQKALSLLQQTPWSIKMIAIHVGYNSGAAFSRAFMSKIGESPSDYRKSKT